MMKNLFFFLIPFFISSCGHTKYAYSYSIEESIDFSNGKWILNEAITNYKSDRIQNIALHYFREILKDSLFEINELRHDKLISTKTPFEPNTKELEDLKIGTECDYLINIKSILVKEEMSSFATAPPIGNTKKTNQAESTIRIYDLNNGILVSESTIIGKAVITKNQDDNGWDYVNTAGNISMKSLSKLIRKYDKNKVIKK